MTSASRRRKIGPGVLTGRILTIIGTVFLVVGVLIGGYLFISLSGTESTQGTILSCSYPQGSCQPTVSFQTQSGQRITFHSSTASSTWAPGDSVSVRYHPNNPQEADVDPLLLFGLLSSIFAGLGLLLAVVGLCLFRFSKNHPSAELITRYYRACENQDYPTAFQYLNPSMTTSQGQQISPDWFTQRALEYDTANGKISNDSIQGYSLNSKSAKYTVQVTRGTKPYKVNLSLLKQGDDWRINSFDLF